METTFTIRPAVPTDARGIAEVHVRTWQATYAGHMPAAFLAALSVDRREEMWSQVLAASASASTPASTPTPTPTPTPTLTPASTPASAAASTSTSPGDAGSAATPRKWVWVAADRSGAVFGFLCLTDEQTPATTEIQALYVLPEAQSGGAGTRLMETALAQARGLGRDDVRLSVLEGNAGARRFYERFGFRYQSRSVDQIAPDVDVPHAHYVRRWDDVE